MEDKTKIIELLSKSYSPFHAVKNIEDELRENGFLELVETEAYAIEPGKSYFVKRNDSSILAFRVPSKLEKPQLKIAAVHTDSPSFKVKPNPIIKRNGLLILNLEPYSGSIYSSWVDRVISIAGRVVVKEKDEIKTKLLAICDDFAVIPNLCIHFNREINDGFSYNPAKHLLPIIGEDKGDFDFNAFLLDKLGIEGEVLSHDLYIFNRDKPRLTGINGEFLSCPRLDDLSADYSCLLGFLRGGQPDSIDVLVAFDNEEVGSLTRQGANSDFLVMNLKRVLNSLGLGDKCGEIFARSFLLSVDNAHANHPLYPEMSDVTTDVKLNGGIVIKHNANQKYTSSAVSVAYVKELASKCGVPVQEYTNRSDLRGGATLGNISNSEISLNSCDIGLPQLAMHSCLEFMGVNDLDALVKLCSAYYGA